MEDDRFKIYIHRLRDGKAEQISETFSSDFLGIEEEGLKFEAPVHVEGTACVSGEDFVLSLRIKTLAKMPCVVCNQFTDVPIEVSKLMHTQGLAELKSGLFRMGELIREGILLELPLIAECCSGQCPDRAALTQFFVKEN
ncbi:MAG: hypothetical protein JSS62_01000 [Verrucomicrobia bacterium]|nr:hypothetical protein [Verrucomicrobiota bacterium]MBS0645264.1 hypothetical protein [Verrucomicrobiota bacterium]